MTRMIEAMAPAPDAIERPPGGVFAAYEAVMRFLRAGDVRVVELRPRDATPETMFEGDFDFLFDEGDFGAVLLGVHEACRAHGVSFRVLQGAPFKRRIELLEAAGERRVVIELWACVELAVGGESEDRRYSVIRWAQLAPFISRSDGGWRLAESVRALVYITHLHYKRKPLESAQVKERLRWFQGECNTADGARAAALLKEVEAGSRTLAGANTEAIAELARVRVRPMGPRRAAAWKKWRKVRRRLRASCGTVVPFIGPDGSGKTSIMDGVMDTASGGAGFVQVRFKSLFRRWWVYTPASRMVRRLTGLAPNEADEILAPLLMMMALATMPLVRLRHRRSPVLMDRFFYDYFVTPLRRDNRPRRSIAGRGVLGRLAPVPGLMVVATCALETLRRRKGELSDDAVGALVGVYCREISARRVPEAIFISTDAALEESVGLARRVLAPRLSAVGRGTGEAQRGE